MLFSSLLILSLYGVSIAIGEGLSFLKLSPFISRKISHILCGITTILLPIFLDKLWSIALLIVLMLIVVISKYFKVFKNVEGPERKNLGTLYFPLGVLISLLAFWSINTNIFIFSVLTLTLADPLAALVGKYFGKYHYLKKKTIEGSVVFYLVTLLLFFVFCLITGVEINIIKILVIIVGSIISTLVEAVNFRGSDNIFIPLVSGLFLRILILN